jgi:hypothetical protein
MPDDLSTIVPPDPFMTRLEAIEARLGKLDRTLTWVFYLAAFSAGVLLVQALKVYGQ